MTGLSTEKALELLSKYGLNSIKEPPKKNILFKFIEQFNNFLTLLLIVAAALSFFIGESLDGALILGIVILNALFGLYQEGKAEEAIGLLKKMTISKVRVIRDGKERELESKYLVPGDLVLVEEGVKVPADAQIVAARNFELNESALTGESLSVSKIENDAVYMGTIVARGRATVKVVATGMSTKFGEIASHMRQVGEIKTPLQKKLEKLTRLIGIMGILISVLVFGLSFLQGTGYFPAFFLAVSLAVAVVPEGLPAVMTITLSVGVKEMAKRKSIIRKLSAIEALGSITLIATDKTGTLTENKMKVNEVYVDQKIYEHDAVPTLENNPFSKMILNGILCSSASLVFVMEKNSYDVLGDPTEGALLYLAQNTGLIPDKVRREWEILDEVPFDSETKRMTVRAKKKHEILVLSKGAPESILSISDKILVGEKVEELTPAKTKEIEKIMNGWAKRGLRVLAFAYKSQTAAVKLKLEKSQAAALDGPTNLIFLGMVAIHDPARREAVEAIRRAQVAGIKTVMITGDNEVTAEAIGVTVGLIKKGDEIMTGEQIEKYSDRELLKILPRVRIFARTSPIHKYRIVSLYQKLGEIVAVTGDGVNDVIALKQADVGIAMGLVGTDVARETADMVITDDNFATIVNAVEEGRNIIKNLKNAIKYLLSCNAGEAISLLFGLILGIPTLFLPIQLLFINLITDGVPALSLAFSPRQLRVMNQPPKKEMTLLEGFDKKYIFLVGSMSAILVLFAYYYFERMGIGRTAAFCVLTLIQSFIFVDLWLSHRSLRKHVFYLISPIFILAFIFPFITQFLIVKFSFLSLLFKIEAVPFNIYFQFILVSAAVFLGTKLIKRII